jgi:HEPN domain-containing protein
MDDAVFLNSVYRGRYPTEEGLLPHGEPTGEDARRALKAAETVMKRVRALLGETGGQ